VLAVASAGRTLARRRVGLAIAAVSTFRRDALRRLEADPAAFFQDA
jgi:hypothetical protein